MQRIFFKFSRALVLVLFFENQILAQEWSLQPKLLNRVAGDIIGTSGLALGGSYYGWLNERSQFEIGFETSIEAVNGEESGFKFAIVPGIHYLFPPKNDRWRFSIAGETVQGIMIDQYHRVFTYAGTLGVQVGGRCQLGKGFALGLYSGLRLEFYSSSNSINLDVPLELRFHFLGKKTR